jgi:hypothetical protein
MRRTFAMSTNSTLFDTAEAKPTTGKFVLWFAPSGKRVGWSALYSADTEYACVSFMADHRTGGHGRYMILPASQTP